MFKELQVEQKRWAKENFGTQSIVDYAMGMIEEVGELAHAVLKAKQGIRNNEDHHEAMVDAIGDITIFLVGYCSLFEIDMEELNTHDLLSVNPNVVQISIAMNNVLSCMDTDSIENLLCILESFCNWNGFSYQDAVRSVWDKVRKRDWNKNPDNVGGGSVTPKV